MDRRLTFCRFPSNGNSRTYSPQTALKSTADIIAIPSVNPAIDSEDSYWNRRGSCYLLRRKPAGELILYVGNCVRCILFAHINAAFHLQAFVRISPYRLHGCGTGIPLLCISCTRSSTAVAATSVSLTVFVFWLSGLSLRRYVDHVVPNLSLHCRGYSLKVFCDGTDRVFLNLAHAQWSFFSQGSICRIACAFRTCKP